MFELKVKQINGGILTVELENGKETLVSDVKAKLVNLTETETDRQRLIFTGRVLKDDDKLSDYGISEESTIQLVIRPHDIQPSTSSNSNPESAAAAPNINPLFRNLGNGVVMGSITLDAPNLSQDNLQVQNIIGQMMNLAQSFVGPQVSSVNEPPRQSQRDSSGVGRESQPIPTTSNNSSPPQSNSSTFSSESMASAHLQATLQMLQNPAMAPPPNSHLDIVLNDFFRVLNALQVPVVNLTRELPPNFDDSMISSLSGEALSQMIQLSHILRSLSAAATHLSSSLDRVTRTNPSLSSAAATHTHSSAAATHTHSDSYYHEEQAREAVSPLSSGDQDVILDDISIDDEVD